ncbi:MAG TPA: VTT domain-containing protein [Acetobacteraceae bacterium]|nr:VTT domain-containing protein [Acetobacteraceae bacterium]
MIAHIVHNIVFFGKTHVLLAYGLAFLLTGAEAFPVVGALVPGTAVIIALGALVPDGALHFLPLVIFATAGAVAGDGLSYWLGHHYKGEALSHWPLQRYPTLLKQGEEFFDKHGGKAVLVARFTPGVRAVVPLVAGITGMTTVRFYSLNILSALLWAPAHVAMGVLVGASLTILGAVAGRLEAVVLAFFILIGIIIWLVPHVIRWLTELMIQLRGPVLIWAGSGDGWFRRQIISLLDPVRTELPGLAALGVLLLGSLWVLFGVLQDLLAGDPLVHADHAVFHLLLSLRTAWAVQLASLISELSSGIVLMAVAAIAAIWLDRQNAWRAVVYVIGSVIGAIFFSAGFDLALQRPRPSYIQPGWSLFPFPGGHLAVAAALLGFLTVLICRKASMRSRIAAASATVLFVGVLTFCRLFLGMEFLSTGLEGLAFGFAWSALLSLAYLAREAEPVHPTGLGVAVALTFALIGGANIALAHRSDMRHYALPVQTQTLSFAGWRRGGWANLPARRLALFGEFDQPFTFQWLGEITALKSDLEEHGWTASPNWTIHSALEFLSPHIHLLSLPVLPRLASGRIERLVMIKGRVATMRHERLVFQLWRSNVLVSMPDGKLMPIWIGMVTSEHIKRMFSSLNIPKSKPNLSLRHLIPSMPCSRIVRRTKGGKPLHAWDGKVLLGISGTLCSSLKKPQIGPK